MPRFIVQTGSLRCFQRAALIMPGAFCGPAGQFLPKSSFPDRKPGFAFAGFRGMDLI